jgi:hypothetical protein
MFVFILQNLINGEILSSSSDQYDNNKIMINYITFCSFAVFFISEKKESQLLLVFYSVNLFLFKEKQQIYCNFISDLRHINVTVLMA